MTDAAKPTQPARPRAIRVFVSSTFRDMQAERDELVKRVFPQLRSLCEQRGVAWGEVDLRWGVTDEQAAEGQVLPICLAEIRRCRPYFIGLLGDRYGWVPGEIPAELVQQEPWLAQHRDHSVTELEILHGVLNDPAMAGQAYFYFRDPAYVDSLPAGERSAQREEATPEEIERYGAAEAQRRAAERRPKLQALKERIRASGLPVREGYPTPEALGELVLNDLTAVIDRLYPEGTQPDPLDREAEEHEAFARSRAGVYIGGAHYYGLLDAHAQGDGPPLVVLGESGLGKSALQANWALRYRDKPSSGPTPAKASFWSRLVGRPQPASQSSEAPLVIMHFIGATPLSADWAGMLRRIMGEFQRRLGVQGDIPDQRDALRAAFANWLSMAAARGRVVLLLDGLNQLEDRDQAPDLVWLPPQIPANVRLILSTLPGRPLDALKERGWPVLEVQPLALEERRRLIVDYLAQYTKALSPARAERVADAPQCANPLYLRALLEELRLFGVHQRLDERIGHYLAAGTVAQLYERVLERYEEDYERDRPGLVGEAMSLLWAARRGLSEAELLELLGRDGQPLPRAHWSPLYLAVEASLVDRSGLLGFFHNYLRQAVEQRYLAEERAQQAAHLRLASYFHQRELGPRRVDEEPWQWAEAEAWEPLYALLGDLPFFDVAYRAHEFEVKAYWARVEAGSELRMVTAYRGVLDAPGDHDLNVVGRVGNLLADTGHPVEALSLREHLAEHYRQAGDRAGLAASLGNQALILSARGDLDAAMALHNESESLFIELGDKRNLAASLGNRAVILRDRGDLGGAMALHKEQERLCRMLGNKQGLAISLGNQALILADRGDLDGAMVLHKEQERLHRELGNKAGLHASLGHQATILHSRGDPGGAMALLKEKEHLCRELGDKAGLAVSLGNQATILYARGDLDGAMALHKKKESLCRELGDKAGLEISLGNQALILADRGDLDGAMALHKEEEQLCRDLGDKAGLAASLGNQALILKERGNLDGAMALLEEKERLCRDLGDRVELAASLGMQALIHQDRGDLDGAMALHKEEERLCRELGDRLRLQGSLGNQALILRARGDLDGAMALHKEAERLCREVGDRHGLAISLVNQAAILGLRMNQPQLALPLADEAYRLASECGYAPLAQQIESTRTKIRQRLG